MHGIPAQFDHPSDRAEFRHPVGRDGIELYRAHIIHHAFAPHTHEAFGLGAIEQGVERFRYAGTDHLAPPESIVLMNPDVLHTGRAETEGGWRYRMIYLDPAVLAEISGEPQWWFGGAVVDNDRAGARRLSGLLDGLWRTREPLAFDSLLLRLVGELRPHARATAPVRDAVSAPDFAPVVAYMRAYLDQRIVLADLAAVAGLSPFHFLRRFQARYHVTPQQMLMALRLYAAKRMLAAGDPPAQVAAATGLTDQAHLTHAFARRYGVTPARYQRQVRA